MEDEFDRKIQIDIRIVRRTLRAKAQDQPAVHRRQGQASLGRPDMVETLEESTRIKEERRRVAGKALPAQSAFEETGQAYDAAEVFAALRARAAGKPVRRPRLK